jgi:hypothetical protein
MSFMRGSFVMFVLLPVIALFAVFWGGAWGSDLGGDPDEPAHAVTSLLVRDFLVTADHSAPGHFAREYYKDFPKIALGHYPPFYYVVSALVLLVAPNIGALVALQGVLMAVLGGLVFASARRVIGVFPAVCAALMTMLVPMMWKLGLHVMADWLLACLCYLAVLCWVRYCERPTVGRSLLFGLVAALAILTKGSGIMLGAIPPLVLLLRRQWPLLRTWSWWAASVPVLLLAAPWIVLTAGITKEGMTGQTTLEFFRSAVAYYGVTLPETFGGLWLALAVVGLAIWLHRAWLRSISDREATLLACLGGCLAIILFIPAGLSSRYLAPVVPVLVLLACAGARGVSDLLLPARMRAWAASGLLILALALVLQMHGMPQKEVHGFAEAAAFVQAQPQPDSMQRDFWLVSSEAKGEGAVIAEAAFRLPQRAPSRLRIYRAGKELGASDWLGRGYQPAFATEPAVLAHLDKLGVRWVFVDLSGPEKLRVAHERLLETALRNAPGQWRLARTQAITRAPGVTGELLVYRSLARTNVAAAAAAP